MMIQQAVLHVFDFHTNMCIVSQKELDFSSDVIYEYVNKRVSRILHDAGQKKGIFYATSRYQQAVQKLAAGEMSFADAAAETARSLFDILSHCDEPASQDLLVVDFRDDDDQRQLAILLLDHKMAYTHQILDDDGAVYNQLIQHQAILPGTTQKASAYAIVNLQDFSIRFVDIKRKMDGEELYILPDKLLQCTMTVSAKEAVGVVSKIAEKVADEYGGSTVEALSKAKHYLVEQTEQADTFSPQQLGDMIFAESEPMRQEFTAQLQEAKLPDDVAIGREFAQKTGRSHKIKTDTGIEIIFPSEYIENTDYIQFINNPDGTISIELKGIGKIINK
ncbi:nucleoid-associated protein [uncultured Megasphaera sp.]|uniref:nucleoid-associated protein n=1 Tax=uncultured Megasphaera sp. TaxID=165188 RepID=UPI0026586CD4|nr:nucleoid-associated protein [uncultured Megasphaera sp.]